LHTPSTLRAGSIELDEHESHHARNVLRLKVGDDVELFDDAGHVARGAIERCDAAAVVARVDEVVARSESSGITVASAVPKGDRGDWMIEKLSELGVDRFTPLSTGRSVVHPSGKNKRDRWQRIATESAKQSRRAGVMTIDELTPLDRVIEADRAALYLDIDPGAPSLFEHLRSQISDWGLRIALLVGPEGGWTDEEVARMRAVGLTGVRLTATILRVETAAVAAAAIVATWRARGGARGDERTAGR
jgi:16S rRNA (uracil1498-N3)-methyltransferase